MRPGELLKQMPALENGAHLLWVAGDYENPRVAGHRQVMLGIERAVRLDDHMKARGVQSPAEPRDHAYSVTPREDGV